MDERLKKQLDFLLEIDKEKEIYRQTHILGGKRRENDAEHAWHMAIMAILLSEYANEEIDVLKTVTMLLIHDIVEIDAGDTYAYDEAGNATKAAREKKAADRLYGLLPKEQGAELKQLWIEFEEGKTPEAKFAAALDKIQPVLLNDSSGGRSWAEHKVNRSQVENRNVNTKENAPKLWEYVSALLDENVKKGVLGED